MRAIVYLINIILYIDINVDRIDLSVLFALWYFLPDSVFYSNRREMRQNGCAELVASATSPSHESGDGGKSG